MLTKQQKETLISEISEDIKGSKTIVLCDYKGLTVADLREIRKSLREKGAKMQVAKKTLTGIAFGKAGIELSVKSLPGQAALVTGGEDEISSPKIIAGFAKKNDKLKILGGTLEGKILSAVEVLNLAKLPSKEEMIAKTVYTIKAPISGFVNVLAGNVRGLVNVLSAIKDNK